MAKIIVPWILVAILIGTNGLTGYYAYQYRSDLMKAKQDLEAASTSEEEATTNELDIWQRISQTDDYSFAYPARWFVKYLDGKDNLIFIDDENELKTLYNPPEATEYIPQSWVVSFKINEKVVVDDSSKETVVSSKEIFDKYINYTYNTSHGEFSLEVDGQQDVETTSGLKGKKITGVEPEALFPASKFIRYEIYDAQNQRILQFQKTFIDYIGSLDKYSDLLSDIEKTVKSLELI